MVIGKKGHETATLGRLINNPSVAYGANELHLSANDFGDLIKKETGKSAQDYIQTKVIEVAKTSHRMSIEW